MNRYRPEVPISEPNWRPERVRDRDAREDRLEMLDALDNLAPEPALRFRGLADGEEFRPGYLAQLQERISPPPKPAEEAEALVRPLYRIVGHDR